MTSEDTPFISGNGDRVAIWEVPLNSGIYTIEFDHGTTSGRRVVRVNGEEIIKREWMFKLVGFEDFPIGPSRAKISIEPFDVGVLGLFAYRYCLEVDGKPFKQFVEKQSKVLKTWIVKGVDGSDCRIVLERNTLNIWVNGQKVETEAEFTDGGTINHFQANNSPACLHALTTGVKKQPMIYSLTYNGEEIPESTE